MRRESWGEFFFYVVRILLLLILLALLLPKIAQVWGAWMSALDHGERQPSGNPMRVESRPWTEFVIHILPRAGGKVAE
ncbi:hypothetical protein CEB3_c23350 [Peptococcaceae bacterium CEB3]|nr:hypothetical protein CEB3_c23350 [Peptococcaceae bacterium CEB3]